MSLPNPSVLTMFSNKGLTSDGIKLSNNHKAGLCNGLILDIGNGKKESKAMLIKLGVIFAKDT